MIITGQIKRGAYFDSVTLMNISKKITGMEGVINAAVVMGTKENRALLASAGLLTSEFKNANDTDLLISVKTENEQLARDVFDSVDQHLEKVRTKVKTNDDYLPKSIDSALKIVPDANLALVSVAGQYACVEAMKALENGLHVMLFSDNVPLVKEIELKRIGREKGLLVMGPDCGTAIINGVPLGFANVVSRGNIGIVAASGTGLQEVSSIISNEGSGISQAIGTGGRDVKKDVGGIMFIEALKALADDKGTKVILLISKPPDREVLQRINVEIDGIDKPVVSLFLGIDPKGSGHISTLEEAALTAVAISKDRKPDEFNKRLQSRDSEIRQLARQEAQKRQKEQMYLRGLFSGGTFCAEAQIIFGNMISDVYSNVPAGKSIKLDDPLKSQMNTVIDLGEDEFTVGRPHPMIDYSLRNNRIRQELENPQMAVLLLDVVLGYGSNPDPVSELSNVIRNACSSVSVICSITGTDKDPQNRRQVEMILKSLGAIVMPTNAAACKLAGFIIQQLGRQSCQ